MSYERIVLALACKDDEAKVIRTAVELAELLDAELNVIHVNDEHAGEPSMMMDSPPEHEVADVREQLRKAGFAKQADAVDVDVVRSESYAEVISKASAGADLLVIGHSHRNSFLEALTRTLDEEIANVSGCPVIVVPKN